MYQTILDKPTQESDSLADPPAVPVTVRIGLLGLGRVGQAVAQLCMSSRELLRERDVELRVAGALVRDVGRERSCMPSDTLLTDDVNAFLARRYDVVVEVLGGVEPANALVTCLLYAGVPVVTANKSLMAAHGEKLFGLAREKATSLRCEASAVAGVPFLDSLKRRPFAAGVQRISGILNGTSNYVLSLATSRRISLAEALDGAKDLGLTEPDATHDISGIDAAEKLIVILLHLGVGGVEVTDIETVGIEAITPRELFQARAFGGRIKPLAYASIGDASVEAFVGPAFVANANRLAHIGRQQNALRLQGSLIGDVMHFGPGAGPGVTAAAILDDVVEIAVSNQRTTNQAATGIDVRSMTCSSPTTAWFLRLCFPGEAPAARDLGELLGSFGVWFRRWSTPKRCLEGTVLYGITCPCASQRLEQALAALNDATGSDALKLRVVED